MNRLCAGLLLTVLVSAPAIISGGPAAPPALAQAVGARNDFKVGRTHFEKGEYQKAIDCFEKAIKQEANYPDAYYLLGMSYLGLKNYDKAREKLEYTIRLDSTFLSAYHNLGNVYLEQKKYKEAKEHFEKMKNVPKAAPAAIYCLGVLAYVQGDLKEAEKQWRESIRLDAKSARPRYNLGVLHEAQDRKKEALIDYADASRLEPEHPGYLTAQAFLQVEFGNKPQAKGLLDKAKRVAGKREDWGFVAEGLSQFMTGNFDKTILACDLAIKRNPDLTSALILKARALEQQKKPQDARKIYEAVLESDPNVKEAKLALERIKPADPPKPEGTPTPAPTTKPSSTPTAKPTVKASPKP